MDCCWHEGDILSASHYLITFMYILTEIVVTTETYEFWFSSHISWQFTRNWSVKATLGKQKEHSQSFFWCKLGNIIFKASKNCRRLPEKCGVLDGKGRKYELLYKCTRTWLQQFKPDVTFVRINLNIAIGKEIRSHSSIRLA